jgi:hypothetical protein
MKDPRFTAVQAVEFTTTLKKVGAAVTWDVPVQRNGVIAGPFLEQLTAIGESLR